MYRSSWALACVERHHHRADERAAVLDREPLRAAGHPEGHLVVLPHTAGEQPARETLGIPEEHRVADATVGRDDRLAVSHARGLRREHVAHRRAQEGVALAGRQHGPHANAGLYSACEMWKMEGG